MYVTSGKALAVFSAPKQLPKERVRVTPLGREGNYKQACMHPMDAKSGDPIWMPSLAKMAPVHSMLGWEQADPPSQGTG